MLELMLAVVIGQTVMTPERCTPLPDPTPIVEALLNEHPEDAAVSDAGEVIGMLAGIAQDRCERINALADAIDALNRAVIEHQKAALAQKAESESWQRAYEALKGKTCPKKLGVFSLGGGIVGSAAEGVAVGACLSYGIDLMYFRD